MSLWGSERFDMIHDTWWIAQSEFDALPNGEDCETSGSGVNAVPALGIMLETGTSEQGLPPQEMPVTDFVGRSRRSRQLHCTGLGDFAE